MEKNTRMANLLNPLAPFEINWFQVGSNCSVLEFFVSEKVTLSRLGQVGKMFGGCYFGCLSLSFALVVMKSMLILP
jgi:hypothetical protein